jgi:hypothetical protein
MTFHARVRSVLDLFHSLIAAFVPLIAGSDGKLSTFFNVHNKRDGQTGFVRPARCGLCLPISAQVSNQRVRPLLVVRDVQLRFLDV